MKVLRTALVALSLVLPGAALAGGTPATLYKSPTCGCCTAYADYLEANGFDVEVVVRDDMDEIKSQAGVPARLQSCHTTMIGRYAVEGHVPVEAIDKLMQERPFTRGIAMPGMPAGSPGMGGSKQGPFQVFYISDRDHPRLFHSQ